MFSILGKFVSRFGLVLLGVWVVTLVGITLIAPRWRDVAHSGEFSYLPEDSPSRQGERLLKQAFPDERTESSLVIVLHREDAGGLRDADKQFVAETLEPGLKQIAETEIEGEGESESEGEPSIIVRIRTFQDREAGPLLLSSDGKATLVLVDLTKEWQNREILPTIETIDAFLERLQRENQVPKGLELSVTGSAAVGRDTMQAEANSAHDIQSWTVWVIIILLLLIYRAPLVAFLPLVTVVCALHLSLKLLAMLGQAGYLDIFRGLEVYTTVLVYGAGVDYSLFLIARFREEMDAGESAREATAGSIGKVGAAVAASAGTVIFGIGMLYFAEFGKFQLAGITVPFSLMFMLLAALTLLTPLLRLAGRWAFWPQRPEDPSTPLPPGAGPVRRLGHRLEAHLSEGIWERIGLALRDRPCFHALAAVAIMAPLAVVGLVQYNRLSFGLVSDLPSHAPSVEGTDVLMKHFPAGAAGQLTLILRNDQVDFSSDDGVDAVKTLAERLKARKNLPIADIRSVADPLGMSEVAKQAIPKSSGFGALFNIQKIVRQRAVAHYVSDAEDLDHHVTRLEMLQNQDPFSLEAINRMDSLREAVASALPETLEAGTRIYFTGATSSLRDLRGVADRDRVRIQSLVTVAVLVILMLLLRAVAIPLYLVLTVLFSYLVTLGVAFLVFRVWAGPDFPGLHWTVPTFLFTLLIAVGEDYNIFLITRIEEEQDRLGPIDGVTHALKRTGGIISACGLIMAGTFASLAIGGTLSRMYQLGFALAFGVLLDTFIVRPILVPAYLIWVNSADLGRWGRYLGARRTASDEVPETEPGETVRT